MIKVSVVVQRLDQLEGLVAQLAVLDLKLGGLTVVPDEEPPRRSQAPKRSTKEKSKPRKVVKRRAGNMRVRLSNPTAHVPAKMLEAKKVLDQHFGTDIFEKREATAVIQEAMKMRSRPTAYVSALMDAGAIVQA